MRWIRIFPARYASTSSPLSVVTRNIVLGSASVIVPVISASFGLLSVISMGVRGIPYPRQLGLCCEIPISHTPPAQRSTDRSEEHTSELQSQFHLLFPLFL